jgi:murein DD-endopeptidase MepM/ murein hydrolase activator NlpD
MIPAQRPAPTTLLWPAQGTVTAPYGNDGGRHHPGIDIGILRSLEVRAAAAGEVLRVGPQPGYEGYGNVVEIDAGGGYTTLYAHLASARVRRGQEVEAGMPIAVAGCTGWCTGTHLHFELRLHGRAVNPNRIPLGYTRTPRAVSSVGRAPARQAGGHWFEPSTAHLTWHRAGRMRASGRAAEGS